VTFITIAAAVDGMPDTPAIVKQRELPVALVTGAASGIGRTS
jgi:hypothetical protein